MTCFGKLDCFIGNVGIWDYNVLLVNIFVEMFEIGFYELFNVNVFGYLLGAKVCVLVLIVSEGSMIFILLNVVWYFGGGGLLYIVSKYVVIGFIC